MLREQIKSENYDINFIDTSLKAPVKDISWKSVVGRKIEDCDAVICMVGSDTHSRTAVSWELNQAYKQNVPVIPIKIHRDKHVKTPGPIVEHGDATISWNLQDIQYEINTT